jgi:hypothetical protein
VSERGKWWVEKLSRNRLDIPFNLFEGSFDEVDTRLSRYGLRLWVVPEKIETDLAKLGAEVEDSAAKLTAELERLRFIFGNER